VSGKITRPPFVKFTVPTHGRRTARYFVFHTTEGPDTQTIENLAAYFRGTSEGLGVNYITQANGRMGSLGDFDALTYHVANQNSKCIGVEQVGHAFRTMEQWFEHLHQLWAGVWVMCWVCQERDIPLQIGARSHRYITDAGVCQHRDLPDNNHFDCGSGFPIGWVLNTGRKWMAEGVPPYVKAALPKK
jgi:hypothetical protein